MGNLLEKLQSCRHRMKHLSNVFDGVEPRVLIMGIDGAGKTTLLYKAKLDDTIFANTPPRGMNIELMTPKRGARIQLFDMPGNKITRHLWRNWFRNTEAIVYVVDSSDTVRIDEAKFELHDLLQSRDLRRVPLIVAANKQDADGAMSTDVVSAELDLTSIQDRDWSIHATCAQKGTGIMPMFRDVVDKIKAFRHYKSSLTVKDSDGKAEKLKTDGKDTGIEFTNIEIKDANDNDKTDSLFASLKRQKELENKQTELESEAVSAGSSDSNPPEYDRPTTDYDLTTEPEVQPCQPDALNDKDIPESEENVKVTDLDEDTSESDANVDNKSETNGDESSSVFEFEANAPVAVV